MWVDVQDVLGVKSTAQDTRSALPCMQERRGYEEIRVCLKCGNKSPGPASPWLRTLPRRQPAPRNRLSNPTRHSPGQSSDGVVGHIQESEAEGKDKLQRGLVCRGHRR